MMTNNIGPNVRTKCAKVKILYHEHAFYVKGEFNFWFLRWLCYNTPL